MKIAVLYICTGKYTTFWENFFTSAETFFIPGAQKEYFVFTDASTLMFEQNQRVHKLYQEKLGWPYDTLMRFHFFSRIEKELKSFDYIFFFNANAIIIKPIGAEDILPDTATGLVGVIHPQYYNVPKEVLPVENKQEKSLAYIKKGRVHQYYQGCLNGGTADAYLKLILTLKASVQTDLDNHIIAVWHDESHLNKYFLEHEPKALSPGFAYPEDWVLPFEPKILMMDKSKLGGHNYLRGSEEPDQNGKKKRSIPFLKMVKKIFHKFILMMK